ncbi:MAG: PVC-type heme-binding CxxCH protein [Pirellulaceae bacterium]|nr:PVC-type heme-binding CxxCH protein [Pirellulaceae bacterium]
MFDLRQVLSLIWFTTLIGSAHVDLLLAQSPNAPLPPSEAARTMIVPEGFQVTLFAGEPDVQQPIGFCLDDRGRMWVAEAYNYPNHGTRPGDRIVILEDSDLDGKFDKRTIFYDQLNYVTGIEVGFGGAWVMSPPNFYFIPDRDHNDVPDSQPQVLLDGFGNHANAHNLANGFAWGPDGWLYGTHGRTNWSRIGKPGTPDEQRTQYDGGVYRYHPIRHVWEPYADGTTNPWGIDWNDVGEAFMCNCVNPHLFHVIQGAHYEPWRNRESSQYAYQRIDTIADHLHFVGQDNVRDGLGSTEEDAMGGGHAHCGTMIYLGDSWPDKYRNSVFMNNIHGKRINQDWLRRSGSGYVASHAPDLMRSKDPWHVGVTLQYGPDGGVYVLDWSDTGECHYTKNTQRDTGRVFKITYGNPDKTPVDVAQLSELELVQLHLHRNDWHVRHARRILQERMVDGQDLTKVRNEFRTMFQENVDVTRKLRALWALWAINGADESFLVDQLDHADEHIRSWSIRLLCESGTPSKNVLKQLEKLATTDASALVRLYLASSLQRLPVADRWSLAAALSRRSEDASDPNIPIMIWYGIESLVDKDLNRFVQLAIDSKLALIQSNVARRVSSHVKADTGIGKLIGTLGARRDPAYQQSVLDGILRGLEGRRAMPMPDGWNDVFARLRANSDEGIRQSSIELALIFDDPEAVTELRRQVAQEALASVGRNRALQSLIDKKEASTSSLLLELIDDPALRRLAIRGLAEFDHPETASRLLERYSVFDAETRQDILQTLASRATWGSALMDALEAERVPRRDVTAFTARQLLSINDASLEKRLLSIWGELRSTPESTAKKLASLKKRITPSSLKKADATAGRVLFQKNCSNCHRFFDTGGTIGPDITGAQRMNIDYLLENLLDPSAAVAKDYLMEILLLDGGRTVSGLVVEETELALTIQTVNERLVLPKNEIEQRKLSQVSLMPDGMLNPLSDTEVLHLIAYLTSPKQIPLSQ